MTTANIHLIFNGNCREAMTFYRGCLGGDLFFLTVKASPVASKFPAEMGDCIMHSTLTRDTLVIMATDLVSPQGYSAGNNFGIFVHCASEQDINTFFQKISEGGDVQMPVETQFWGSMFGQLKDKFGILWMFSYEKMPLA